MMARALLVLALAQTASAEDAHAIVHKALDKFVFNASSAEIKMRMILRNKRGDERTRQLAVKTRIRDGIAKTMVNFQSPPDVAGTRFLMLEQARREDDLFLYLPALRKVRRISGKRKNSSFMGSDFSYADLEGRDTEDAEYAMKGEESIGKFPCWKIDATPNTTVSSPYSRMELWIRKKDHVILKTRYFGKSGSEEKTLYVSRTRKVDGRIVITESKMELSDKSHSTTLLIDEIQFRDDFGEDEFTVEKLGI